MKDRFRQKYRDKFAAGKLNVPTGDKDEKFFRKVCEYVFGSYAFGDAAWGYGGHFDRGEEEGGVVNFKELRDYGRGKQSVSKYKDIVDPKDKTKKRKLNISWRTLDVYSKFRNIIKHKLEETYVNIGTVAIDEVASDRKAVYKNKMKLSVQPETKAFLGKHSPQTEEGIDTVQDVEFYASMGGIRLAVEIMMKDGLDMTMRDSDYDVISEMLYEDLIDLNIMAKFVEKTGSKQKVKYIDPAKLIIRNSIYPDFRDSDYRGFVENMKLSELKRLCPWMKQSHIKEVTKGRSNNTSWGTSGFGGSGFREDYATTFGSGGMHTDNQSDFGLEVLTLYFIDTEMDVRLVGRHPSGRMVYDKVDQDYRMTKKQKKSGAKIVKTPIQNLYKVRWVVGTNFVFDYGLEHEIVRDGEKGLKTPMFPIHVYAGHEKSITEKCIGFIDDIQIAKFKIRNLIAKLPPGPRMVLDQSKLEDSFTIAGVEYSILESIENYATSGILIVNSRSEFDIPGMENNNSVSRPFDFVPSGIVEDIAICQGEIQTGINEIRQVTGINEVSDGTSQNKDMLQSVMQGLNAATNSAMASTMKAYVSSHKETARYVMNKFKIGVLKGDINLGSIPIGDSYIKQVVLKKDLAYHDFGIIITVETQEQRQMLLQDLMSKKEKLSPDAYIKIYNVINEGDTKKAQLLLTKFVKEAEELMHNRQKEIAQATSQGNAQAAIATEEAKAKTLMLTSQLDNQKSERERMFKQEDDMINHERAKELLTIKATQDTIKGIAVTKENNKNRHEQF